MGLEFVLGLVRNILTEKNWLKLIEQPFTRRNRTMQKSRFSSIKTGVNKINFKS